MATEDEAKSEQQQKDTDDEQQTKCKKRRIEKEKENLGLPIAQSTPLMPQCQPDQSIIIENSEPITPTIIKNIANLNATALEQHNRKDSGMGSDDTSTTATTATTATTKLSSSSTWITTDVDDETDNTNLDSSSSSSTQSVEEVASDCAVNATTDRHRSYHHH
ncbi:hypothetical protein niasHT_032665 [Heterodera trifolii]|uniref:Uncharacterized protein n=1 Tax=Heterodera trifolii TaxID=157864 RepID=A0ABD2J0I3_9BILA